MVVTVTDWRLCPGCNFFFLGPDRLRELQMEVERSCERKPFHDTSRQVKEDVLEVATDTCFQDLRTFDGCAETLHLMHTKEARPGMRLSLCVYT